MMAGTGQCAGNSLNTIGHAQLGTRRMWHMDKCRTINYVGPGKVEVIEVGVSDPNYGEVQVQGLACGVCAWDVHVFKNGVDWPVWPGHEGVGQVIKVGA